jgi:hypothetical protein
MLRRLVLAAALVGTSLVSTTPALAKAQMDSPYSYRQTFGSALRLIKVDLAFTVTEVDAAWGYVMFEYVSPDSGTRKNRAALQLVESESAGTVQVGLQIGQMPSFHEELLLEKLKQKLTDEHGAPPDRTRKKDPDEGKKKDEDKERANGDEDRRGRNPDNVVILEPERDTLKKRR